MKIINREQIELRSRQKNTERVRRRKTLFILTAYLALIAILTVVYLTSFIKSSDLSIEKNQRYKVAITVLTGSSLLVFTCIFIIHYYRTVYPYTRDLKED